MDALFGGLLDGDAPVRFVYVDEAGTSAHEPVTVVVGIVVHADKQLRRTFDLIKEALATVPEQYREGFIFHAADLTGAHKYREGWSREDRIALLHRMMAIPSQVGLPVAFGAARRDAQHMQVRGEHSLTKEQMDHMFSFGLCLSMADRFMRDNASPSEVGTVVAEDSPKMRDSLRRVALQFSQTPYALDPESPPLGITRLVDTVFFVEKNQASVLQLADACAFGLRRSFSGLPMGAEFEKSIVGQMNRVDGPLIKASVAGVVHRYSPFITYGAS